MGLLRLGALGAAVLGGGGWWMASSVMASYAEHDLDRVGQGVPSVVQIHDPQCSQCRRLQSAAKEAMAGFEEGDLIYLVANIKLEDGTSFAAKHGAGHVTLLLLDGDGTVRDTVRGVTPARELKRRFRSHAHRFGPQG